MSLKQKGCEIRVAIRKMATSIPGNTVNDLRIVVAFERAIARFEASPELREHLIFKGGFVLLKTIKAHRFTRDLDATAINLQRDEIPKLIKKALAQDLGDGLWFGEFQIVHLNDQGPYGGFRCVCAYQIGEPPVELEKLKKLSRIHIDIGVGDKISRALIRQPMSSMLINCKPVSWLVYPPESIFAEKLEALVSRGSTNSRAKDIYDLTQIFSKCSQAELLQAIDVTFHHRDTPIPNSFHSYLAEMDTSMLEAAWPSVQVDGVRQVFGDVWSIFLSQIKSIDGGVDGG